MKQADKVNIDTWLRRVASEFDYPPTPDFGELVQRRDSQEREGLPRRIQPAWALVVLLLALSMLMLVPQVRASVMAVLRSGGITVFVGEPVETTLASTPSPPAVSVGGEGLETEFLAPVVAASAEEAQKAFEDRYRLPVASDASGGPAQVYVDDLESAQIAVLVWADQGAPAYTLYVLKEATFAYKMAEEATATTVGDVEALWVHGPHGFRLEQGEFWEETAGSVLIWTEGELTYRLEGAASLDEAREFAESLR